MIRATSSDELAPLLAMCRAGRLFDVQDWIRQGKPIALPENAGSRAARRNPLRIAMESEFHSLVQVLLEAGAPTREGTYNALSHAVELRRPDIAKLLVQHGANVQEVSMRLVVEMWEPEMTELFVSNGASLTRGKPIAWGLIAKIRPALSLIKKYGADKPEIMRQANIALRHHAYEGNAKWVALLLWAGADPWSKGPEQVDSERYEDEGDEEDGGHSNAVELAIYRGHMEVLTHKRMLCPPDTSRPETLELLDAACSAPDGQVLSLLFERGHSPKVVPDHCSSAISGLVGRMSWGFPSGPPSYFSGVSDNQGIDSSRSRELLKMMHMLVAAGARWLPGSSQSISDVRKCLLKMKPEYTLEFVWLMHEYRAARRKDIQELLRASSMSRHLQEERTRAARLAEAIPEDPLAPSQAALR